MTTAITTRRGQGMINRGGHVDEPASDELERARDLANYFAKQLSLAERFEDKHVKLSIEQARELCQMLHDSIRTADQLRGKLL